MNKQKNTKIFIIAIIIFIVVVISYFILAKKQSPIPKNPIQTQMEPLQIKTLNYINTEYGFSMKLPVTWKGYSIIGDKWNGQVLDGKVTTEKTTNLEGPKILIRHPLWTIDNPRQDIPIMIFTLSEWNKIQDEKLSVGAAPVGPSLLGSNESYVFALPARYNFAYPVGFEEVQKIIESKALNTF